MNSHGTLCRPENGTRGNIPKGCSTFFLVWAFHIKKLAIMVQLSFLKKLFV